MKLNMTGYAIATRSAFVAPTLGAAGDQSARFRVDGHVPAMGHRPWSPPIT